MVNWQAIHWVGATRALWLVPLALIIIIFFWLRLFQYNRFFNRFVARELVQDLVLGYSSWRLWIKGISMTLATISLVIACMQPQWGEGKKVIDHEGRDIVIALDISRSMLCNDFKPSRLEFAKIKIGSLLQELAAERVGLVLFCGAAMVQCPLTVDHGAFRMMLSHVSVETFGQGATALDKALAVSAQCFEKDNRRHSKLIILVTDGEDYSRNLTQVQAALKDQGIALLALGVATRDGAPVPRINAQGDLIGYEQDNNGLVISRLNEELLQSMVNELGGCYERARYDDQDITQFVRFIAQRERERFSSRQVTYGKEQYPWFLGGALAMLLLEWIV